ncbi:hypothetical protein E5K00_02355 [Hymenobacter aquaticus]|uniref:Uncharacterized protein n=1 Tax=Hymenobacter aquaticus TaxID=1867101 RepID=A0A4Z0Q3N0_9BACT|nr:hypothetical protein [Hymenobacter aquaticus]TGE24076.1 hypothetical protein E5K00_02355 [Hymenobacter aquaticus]
MFVSQPQHFAYRSNLSAEALRASADEFIAQQGGPLHPNVYSASWQSATVLELMPKGALHGLKHTGRQRATLELRPAATGTEAHLTVYPATSLSTLFYGIIVVALWSGFSCLRHSHCVHVGISAGFGVLGTGALRVLHQASTRLLRQDLERSFQLTKLA